MPPLIAGNWKMNGFGREADVLATAIRAGAGDVACDLLVCPPAVAIARVAQIVAGSKVAVGGQDCHPKPSGPHTGDLSAPMLKDAGARWVILGHSERRADHHETDDLIRHKVMAAEATGLTPIVCVGESEEQRQGGLETEAVGWQIAGSLPKEFQGVIAYEPCWAIGTGVTPTADQIAAMHLFIREELKRELGPHGAGIRILYGGSVKPGNAAEVLALPEVGGALVGGASLIAEDFLAIARAAPVLSKAVPGV